MGQLLEIACLSQWQEQQQSCKKWSVVKVLAVYPDFYMIVYILCFTRQSKIKPDKPTMVRSS